MKKKILFIILIGAAVAGGVGYYMYNKPAEKTISAKEEFTVDAAALFQEFTDNEAQANQKYLNKVIAVKGKVLDITPNDSLGINLTLETGDAMFGVSCHIPEPGKAPQKGDVVSVKGLCTGMLMDVVLVKCSINAN